MYNTETARTKFFSALSKNLKEQGEPFYFSNRSQYAIINRDKPSFHETCVSIDFIWTKGYIRTGIYLEDDVDTYNSFLRRKEEIESALGFECLWLVGEKNPNTRRVVIVIPFDKYDVNFDKLAKDVIPKIEQFIEVFRGEVNC